MGQVPLQFLTQALGHDDPRAVDALLVRAGPPGRSDSAVHICVHPPAATCGKYCEQGESCRKRKGAETAKIVSCSVNAGRQLSVQPKTSTPNTNSG